MEPVRQVEGHGYWCALNWSRDADVGWRAPKCTCQPIDAPPWTTSDMKTTELKCRKCGAPPGHYCRYVVDTRELPQAMSDYRRSSAARARLAKAGRPTLAAHQERRDAYARRAQRRIDTEVTRDLSFTRREESRERQAISRANQEAMLREYRELHDWLVRHASVLVAGPSTVVNARELNQEERNQE